VRIDPRTSLSVQLIQQANFGSERFEPFGPPLRQDASGPLPFRSPDAVLLSPPIENKPETCPADTPICDARIGPVAAYRQTQERADPTTRIEVREVTVPTILPTHVVGSLLDVLA